MIFSLLQLDAAMAACIPTRVMPLGDSITAGESSGVPESDLGHAIAYRDALYDSLIASGRMVDFVGGIDDGWLVAGLDSNHEGHGGWTSGQVASSVYQWLVDNPADIVLLHIGTNSPSVNVSNVAAILDQIDQYESDFGLNTTVVVAQIIQDSSGTNPVIATYNQNLADLVTNRVAAGDDLLLVDMENALTYPDDMYNNLHPAPSGYQKMADVWQTAVEPLIPVCATPDTVEPSIPAGLTGQPMYTSQMYLSWGAASDTGGTGWVGYRIYRDGLLVGTTNHTDFMDTGLNPSTTYSYTVEAYDTAGNVSGQSPPVDVATLPSPIFTDTDIGAVAVSGSLTDNAGTLTIQASGADIWDPPDEFNFAYETLNGDGEIVARVVSLVNTNEWAKAGVMIREQLTANSKYADMVLTPSKGAVFQYRTLTGGSSGPAGGGNPAIAAPYWVKLVRAGNKFTGYIGTKNRSSDGQTWVLQKTVTISMASSVYIGLAVTSHNDGVLTTAVFDNVSTIGTAPPVPDTEPPSQPQNLTATAVSDTRIDLGWDPSTDTGGSGLAGYEIYRDGNSTPIATVTDTHYSDMGLQANRFYTYTVTAIDNAVNPSTPSLSAGATTLPPSIWTNTDIGAVAVSGSVTDNAGTLTIQASGADIWDPPDEFNFAYETLNGDGEIVARVVSLVNTNEWAKAGVMIREQLTANSKYADMVLTASWGAVFQYRTVTGGSSGPAGKGNPAIVAPYWVKLVRAGNLFSGYISTDGQTWVLQKTVTISMASSVYIGLAVTSHNDGVLTTAVFDNVSTIGTAPPVPDTEPPSQPQNLTATAVSDTRIDLGWDPSTDTGGSGLAGYEIYRDGNSTPIATVTDTHYSDTGLTINTLFTYTVTAIDNAGNPSTPSLSAGATTLPTPPIWTYTDTDIGAVAVSGSLTDNAGTLTIQASGADIWDPPDEFNFAYETLNGDGEIVARVVSLVNTNEWAKAGVMIREQLTANSKYADMVLTASKGAVFQYRTLTGGSSGPAGKGNPAIVAPYWVKLVRAGNLFSGYISTDGQTWVLQKTVTISMASSVYIGLAVTSHNDGVLTTAVFDNVSTIGTAPPVPDTEPPSQPQNLTATAVSDTRIDLGWDPSTDTGGSGLAGYEIYRDGNSTPIATVTDTHYSDTGLTINTLFTYTVTAIDNAGNPSTPSLSAGATTLPTPPIWTYTDTDIGAVAVSGSLTDNAGTLTIQASGADIWDPPDEFNFAYETLNGDGEIVARVVSLVNTNEWAKAGVMIREQLTANSKYADMVLTPSKGAVFQYRTLTGGSSGPAGGGNPAIVAPYWVKLVRAGNLFSGYISTDGQTWVLQKTVTISMASSVYIGLAVTSHNDGVLTTAVFDNISVIQ